MIHKFREGEKVTLLSDSYTDLSLSIGAVGTVWVEYEGESPSYEVTFCDNEGEEFDISLGGSELAPALTPCLEEAAA